MKTLEELRKRYDDQFKSLYSLDNTDGSQFMIMNDKVIYPQDEKEYVWQFIEEAIKEERVKTAYSTLKRLKSCVNPEMYEWDGGESEWSKIVDYIKAS